MYIQAPEEGLGMENVDKIYDHSEFVQSFGIFIAIW
jgi:hypothetical protein